MKQFIKSLIPPILLNLIKKINNKSVWTGNYNSWQEAQDASTGYDDDTVLNKVKKALLKVKNGEATYERDSVIFDRVYYSWPLLSGLMLASSRKLSVLDFGGSLGSTYYQNRKFLDELDEVRWSIVEQEHFVNVGKQEFEDEKLKFYQTVDICLEEQNPNVLLFSSVLQYIENPYELLDNILLNEFEYIVIDRTSFSTKNEDTIKVQTVPESIYKASYPCWFFDESSFLQFFINKGYRLVESFDGADSKGEEYYFKGMIWRKNV